MAVIVDPDNLNDGTEIVISTAAKTVKLQASGNMTTDGVTLKCVYSKLKELWKSNATYIQYPFPMGPITDEQYELINGWDFDKNVSVTTPSATVNLIRTGGWALKDTSGVSQEEWAGIVTLGTLGGTDQVYYQQVAGVSGTNIVLPGVVNQAVKVYGDASHGNFDYRGFFKIFCRPPPYNNGSRIVGKIYAASQISDIGVSTMTYQVYRFPLANSDDLKVSHLDTAMTGSPYVSMSITWYTGTQTQTGFNSASLPAGGGGTTGSFHVIINGNNGSAEQIYEYVQYELRQVSDIDAGTGAKTGSVAADLLKFTGDSLATLSQSSVGGVFISNYSAGDINRLSFADDAGNVRTYPYAAALTLQFGANLVADTGSIYHVYFTNDDAGINTGRDFGTATAITVNDKNSVAMSGNVNGSASIQLTYDYDGNNQRGAGSPGQDAPITVVAIGLNTAQYVSAQGTIQKSTSNAVSLVAPLERNYKNP